MVPNVKWRSAFAGPRSRQNEYGGGGHAHAVKGHAVAVLWARPIALKSVDPGRPGLLLQLAQRLRMGAGSAPGRDLDPVLQAPAASWDLVVAPPTRV